MRPALALLAIEDSDLVRQIESAIVEAHGRIVVATDEPTLLRSLDRHVVTTVFTAVGGSLPVDRILAAVRRRRAEAPLIVVGTPGSDALRDVEDEVFDVLRAPVDRSELELMLRRAMMHHELLAEVSRLRGLCGTPDPLDPLVGRSESMAVLRERIGAAALRGRAVLLVGEQGTGRSLAARTIHAASSRRLGPFVTADGAGDGVADHADPDRAAAAWAEDAFARAEAGTLFLAEADRLTPDRQRQLAAAIEARTGSETARRVSSATRDLTALASAGVFDERLSGLLAEEVVHVPALRDRERDVHVIARRHLETLCALNGLPPARLEPAALTLLESYSWPGNVAELRETIEHALTLAPDGVIRPEHLGDAVRASIDGPDGEASGRSPRRFRDAKRRVVDSFERSYLEDLLGWHRGNVTAAAEQAGMLRSALQRLLRKHDLRSSEFRDRGRGGPWRVS